MKIEIIRENADKDVIAEPGESTQHNEKKSVDAPHVPEKEDTSAEADLINKFRNSTVAPEVRQQAQEQVKEALKDAPLDGLHKSLLDSGTIEKWLVKILSWGFVNFNVWIYNMIFSGKKKVIKSEIEMDEQDKLTLEVCCHEYAPQLMEYLKKLNPIVLSLIFIESNMIANMNRKAHVIEPEKKEEK